ncbi:MAG: glycosyltransferase [Clostridia bacterium]|nr:glycosyltransferase [Clostridia bacterium]
MKHIVFVVGNYKNGGVAMRSTNLANAFAEKGYICTILVTREIGNEVFFNLHENVRLVSLKEYISVNKATVEKINEDREKQIRRIKQLRYIAKFNKIADRKLAENIKELRKGAELQVFMADNKDAVYITFGIGSFEKTYCASKNLGCKLIYAERNAPELEYPEYNKVYLLSIVEKACGAVLQTKTELEFFENRLHAPVVINNPVKAGLPDPYQGERRKVIVNFCRIAKQKNLPLLLEAFMLLHNDFPEYILEIYGNTVVKEEEELLIEYRESVEKLGASDYIKLLPPRGDVHEVIKDAKMFVSSSDFEGLSNSMLEALAIGLPCVCTDCLGGGAREMITDGENGLLVPMNDANALYLAMKRMIENEELLKKCSENAAKVRATHNAESIAKQWIDYIESVT